MTTASLLPASWPLPPELPFTVDQARKAGVAGHLPRLLRARVVRRLLKSVYVADLVEDSILLRARALALVVPPGCFVTDRCAGWLHGAEMTLAPNEDILVPQVSFFRPSDEGRLRNGLCVSGERRLGQGDLTEVHGITVTTPLRTALDLGRLQGPDVALAGLDAMTRIGGFPVVQLLTEVEKFAKQRGVRQLRELAPITDPGSESFGESALRRRWYAAELPRPRTQIPIMVDGVEVYRLDLGLEELMFAAEYNGAKWHGSDADKAADAVRSEWITEQRAYQIECFDQAHVFGANQDADGRLRIAYAEAKESFPARRRHVAY